MKYKISWLSLEQLGFKTGFKIMFLKQFIPYDKVV